MAYGVWIGLHLRNTKIILFQIAHHLEDHISNLQALYYLHNPQVRQLTDKNRCGPCDHLPLLQPALWAVTGWQDFLVALSVKQGERPWHHSRFPGKCGSKKPIARWLSSARQRIRRAAARRKTICATCSFSNHSIPPRCERPVLTQLLNLLLTVFNAVWYGL